MEEKWEQKVLSLSLSLLSFDCFESLKVVNVSYPFLLLLQFLSLIFDFSINHFCFITCFFYSFYVLLILMHFFSSIFLLNFFCCWFDCYFLANWRSTVELNWLSTTQIRHWIKKVWFCYLYVCAVLVEYSLLFCLFLVGDCLFFFFLSFMWMLLFCFIPKLGSG